MRKKIETIIYYFVTTLISSRNSDAHVLVLPLLRFFFFNPAVPDSISQVFLKVQKVETRFETLTKFKQVLRGFWSLPFLKAYYNVLVSIWEENKKFRFEHHLRPEISKITRSTLFENFFDFEVAWEQTIFWSPAFKNEKNLAKNFGQIDCTVLYRVHFYSFCKITLKKNRHTLWQSHTIMDTLLKINLKKWNIIFKNKIYFNDPKLI